MVKFGLTFISLSLLTNLLLLGSGCSSPTPKVTSEDPPNPSTVTKRTKRKHEKALPPTPVLGFKSAEIPSSVKKLWTQKLDGLITDLSVAESGKAILVATAPDRENDPSATLYHLDYFSPKGKLIWSHPSKTALKSASLSPDGSLVVFETYENQIFGMSGRGEVLWSIEGNCKPIPIAWQKRVLCYHDDDPEPGTAFDVYTWEGKKILSYPIANDILLLKMSEDKRNMVIALTEGEIVLFGSDFRPKWQKKVPGEIIDIAVSSSSEPRVAALFVVGKKVEGKQKLVYFDALGKKVSEGVPANHAEQIEISPDGASFAAYGNSENGQYLGFFTPDGKELSEKWKRGDSKQADYSSAVNLNQNTVILGFEQLDETGRHSHMLGFDFSGDLKWNIPLVTEEGAYNYAHALSLDQLLAVGTDDNKLNAYRLNQ